MNGGDSTSQGSGSSAEYSDEWGRPWKEGGAGAPTTSGQTDSQATEDYSMENDMDIDEESLEYMRNWKDEKAAKQKAQGGKIKRKKKPRLWRGYSDKDTEEYRKGNLCSSKILSPGSPHFCIGILYS